MGRANVRQEKERRKDAEGSQPTKGKGKKEPGEKKKEGKVGAGCLVRGKSNGLLAK